MPPGRGASGRAAAAGSQTLLRGLDLLEAVVDRPAPLSDLSKRLDINRSTIHRLASALVDRGYMKFVSGEGYMLGPRLLGLGHAARRQIDLTGVARPHLETLCAATGDVVHLGVLNGDRVLYLDKLAGGRRIDLGSRVGERQPLCSTGLGKSLLLDRTEAEWHVSFHAENGACADDDPRLVGWIARMRVYAEGGYSFDREENEDRVRCVAAPVRDDSGAIVAAISVSGVAPSMSDARMAELVAGVSGTAAAISRDLGWAGVSHPPSPSACRAACPAPPS